MQMNYKIIDNMENIKIDKVVRLLKMTYWADKRKRQIEKDMYFLGSVS